MKYLSLEEIKKIEFDMLCYIANICDEENIDYYLIGGTLLGAVKYKGFIPWDDDIDICLFRKDYMKLIDILNSKEHNKYKILSLYTTKDYYYTFAKLVDTTTSLESNSRPIKDMGVYLDIFPIDYYDGNYDDFKKNIKFYNNMATRRYRIKNNITKSRNVNTKKEKIKFWKLKKFVYGTLDIISLPLGYRYWGLLFDKKVQGIQKSNNVVIGRENLSPLDAKLFEEISLYEFEGKKFKSIKNYDKYLTDSYGDYKKDLPKEKQITHHSNKSYYK